MPDWIDDATAASEQYQQDALERHRKRRAAQAKVSLTHCEECGKEIPMARRRAAKGCRCCIVCQRALELNTGRV